MWPIPPKPYCKMRGADLISRRFPRRRRSSHQPTLPQKLRALSVCLMAAANLEGLGEIGRYRAANWEGLALALAPLGGGFGFGFGFGLGLRLGLGSGLGLGLGLLLASVPNYLSPSPSPNANPNTLTPQAAVDNLARSQQARRERPAGASPELALTPNPNA